MSDATPPNCKEAESPEESNPSGSRTYLDQGTALSATSASGSSSLDPL